VNLSTYGPGTETKNDATENPPTELVGREEACIVPSGRVLFLVTVLFGVAPTPEIVNDVVPTVPAPGDTLAEKAG
jgi:hypothetical protein